MLKYFTAFLLLFISSVVHAHEMTPTYPVFSQSYMDGLLVTEVEVFNKRQDVEYYEVGVFDKNFKAVPFVTTYKVFKLDYLKRVKLEVYIRQKDEEKVMYICSRSRIAVEQASSTNVSSTICSKIKRKQ